MGNPRVRGVAALAVCAAAAVVMAGCKAAPVPYAESGLANPVAAVERAPQFWNERGLPEVPLARVAGAGPVAAPRVAVVEFTVEFITHKVVGPFRRQAIASTTEFGEFGLPMTILGIGRHSIDYDRSLKENLPYEFYLMFVRELERAGFGVVPMRDVTASAAYGGFRTARPGSARPAQLLSIFSSDTGRVKRAEYWPAGDLSVITGARRGTVEQAARRVMREVGARAALRARFRVGVWIGYASVEEGSHVEVITMADDGRLVSDQSLVSDRLVVEEAGFRLFRGRVYPVDTSRYMSAMDVIFPPYARMAIGRLLGGEAQPALAARAGEPAGR